MAMKFCARICLGIFFQEVGGSKKTGASEKYTYGVPSISKIQFRTFIKWADGEKNIHTCTEISNSCDKALVHTIKTNAN